MTKWQRAYNAWTDMHRRCNNIRRSPTYEGCYVSPEWLEFEPFYKWMTNQEHEGQHLDKDLLSPTMPGKLYTPDMCCFVPRWLNNVFLNCSQTINRLPRGVCKHGNKFRARLSEKNSRVCLGLHPTALEAHTAWVSAKIAYTEKRLKEDNIRSDIVDGVRRHLAAL